MNPSISNFSTPNGPPSSKGVSKINLILNSQHSPPQTLNLCYFNALLKHSISILTTDLFLTPFRHPTNRLHLFLQKQDKMWRPTSLGGLESSSLISALQHKLEGMNVSTQPHRGVPTEGSCLLFSSPSHAEQPSREHRDGASLLLVSLLSVVQLLSFYGIIFCSQGET